MVRFVSANISMFRYEGKENSMEFMNGFLDDEINNMKNFLQGLVTPIPH